jgi:hypothetical protein
MTSREGLPIRAAFDKTFPRSRVQRLAEDHGAMTRRLRKMDMRALVLSLALGGLDGVGRTLESMRRLYQRIAGHQVARSSFHDRLNEGLAATLRTLVEECALAAAPPPAGPRG